jgi:hypothetical protein
MTSRFGVVCVLLCGLLGSVVAASAAPIQWKVEDGGNRHFYNVVAVSRGISWPDADAAAIARGSVWHLATITSLGASRTDRSGTRAGVRATTWSPT